MTFEYSNILLNGSLSQNVSELESSPFISSFTSNINVVECEKVMKILNKSHFEHVCKLMKNCKLVVSVLMESDLHMKRVED